MMLDQVLDVDPTNQKAWQRKIQNLITFGDIDGASQAILKAEKGAFLEDDKVKLRQFRAKIVDIRSKEKDFSKKVFSQNIYEDKPAAAKQPTPEELNKEENEMLPSLSNIGWLLYPFVKTAKALASKLCKGGNKDKKTQ